MPTFHRLRKCFIDIVLANVISTFHWDYPPTVGPTSFSHDSQKA